MPHTIVARPIRVKGLFSPVLMRSRDDDFYARVHSSVDRSSRLRALRSVAALRATHDEEPRQMWRIGDGG
jgi:hypothetical protein